MMSRWTGYVGCGVTWNSAGAGPPTLAAFLLYGMGIEKLGDGLGQCGKSWLGRGLGR